MSLLNVNEPEEVPDVWPKQRKASLQDVCVGRPLGRQQKGLCTTGAGDELFVLCPAGSNEVPVIPDNVQR